MPKYLFDMKKRTKYNHRRHIWIHYDTFVYLLIDIIQNSSKNTRYVFYIFLFYLLPIFLYMRLLY